MRRAAVVALLVVAAACGGSADGAGDTVRIDGRPVVAATLVEAHVALCQAATQPGQARTLFFDRAHDALHAVARALDDVDRPLAARLLEAKQTVESDLTAGRPALPEDFVRLADVFRAALARLAITAAPCDK